MFGQLTVFDSTGRNPLQFRITQQFTYVGKDKDCDIRLEHSSCAGKQFLLTARGNGPVKIQNLTRKFATQVNEKSIGFHVDHDLNEKDIIFAAGRQFSWSYRVGAEVVLPQNSSLKRTRNSEPVRKVAVVTPNRREMAVNEDEMIHPVKRRKTVYESTARPYTPHKCSSEVVPPEQSSFSRRISYDRMLKGKKTPSSRGRMSQTSGRRMSSGLSTPSTSGQKGKKLTFDGTMQSPKLVYDHKAAFNKSITPRTFYSGQNNHSVPFTFRGFESVAEESSSSILPDHSYLSENESRNHGRRSSRLSTPVPQKRLTSSFRSARTPGNRNALTGTSSAYFPTIEEGRLMESRNAHLRKSYLHENESILASSLNDLNHSCNSTPASYFSPTSTGSPRMMRAESPNLQSNANGTSRTPYQARRSLLSSGRSTPFGTPQENFIQSQNDSLYVNTSARSHLRRSSFFADQSHFSSHNSNLQSSHSQGFNTPAQLNTPRRSRSAIETPGSTTFSPMSYNDTDYVLLSPRGRDLVNKRYSRSSHSHDFSSPYSPSQNTLDFTASPPIHPGPRFARTPKRSLSMQVLTKSIQKKANYEFNRSKVASPTGRKSRGKSRALSKSKSTLLLASSTRDPFDHVAHDQQSIVEHSETFVLDSDSEPPIRKTTRGSLGEGDHSSRVSRRSQSVPSDSATRKSRKSELESEIKSPRHSGVSLKSQKAQPGSPLQRNSSRKSRKSGNVASQFGSPSSTHPLTSSGRKSRRSGMNGSGDNLEQIVPLNQSRDEKTLSRPSQRSQTGHPGTPTEVRSGRRSRKSGMGSVESNLESSVDHPIASSQGENPSRVSRRSQSAPSGTQTPLSTSRKSRKSGMKGGDESNLESSVLATSQNLAQGENPSRVSRRSQSVLSGTPTLLSTSRKSRKSAIGGDESNVESSVLPTSQNLSQGENPSRVSRRSQSALSGTPTLLSTSRKSRKSGTGGDEGSLESSALPTSQNLSQGEKSSRVSRQSQNVPSGTPTLLSTSRKSRKSGIGGDESNLESSVLPTSQNLSQGENTSRVSRRSQSVPSGTPTQFSTSRKSRKSGRGGDESNLESSVLPTSQNLSQGENPSRVSRRSQSVPSGTPTLLSTSRKSRKSGIGGDESNLESSVLPTPQSLSKEGEDSSRVSRRSRGVPSGTPNTSRVSPQSRSDESGKPRKSGRGSVESHSKSPALLNISEGGANHSTRVSRRSQSTSSSAVTLANSSRRSGKGDLSSNSKNSKSIPTINIISATPTKDHNIKSATKGRKSYSKSPALINVEQSPERSGSSTPMKSTARNSTNTSYVKDSKPVLGANRSIAWPVAVPNNNSGTLQFVEDVKVLEIHGTRRSNRSVPTPSSPRESCSSTLLDESSSTSIANISAIPRSSRRARVVFSTPAPSNSKKSVKVTSTPFPKGLISGRDGTQVSSESTLPIEIDTVNIHSSYISSDSPDYDRITDEESFDLTDVPETSASLSRKTRKVNSKRSVSFVAIKSGVLNRKSLTPTRQRVSMRGETGSPKGTPSNTSLEVNLRSSRKTSTAKKSSPTTPLSVIKTTRMETSVRRNLDNADEFSKRISPESPGINVPSTSASTEVQNTQTTSLSNRRTKSPSTPRGSSSTTGMTTPPRTLSPEVLLRSSRKSSRKSMELSVPGTPRSVLKRNPRRSAKKPPVSAKILKKKLDSMQSPGGSAVKKLKLDPDKPDKKKMAALWVCHKKKSPSKSPVLDGRRRSFEQPAKSPEKLNTSIPRNFKFQASGSSSSLDEGVSEKALTPIKNLDIQPQHLSPEDDLLNALDLSRKSAIVVEPQKPSRRLRSSTQSRISGASTSGISATRKASPTKSPKKLLFRSPLVDYEGSQPREESHFNSSNIKSILIPSPTRSSDEPMSRVFTTSPVMDYTDSSGKKKIFRASPTSKSGGIKELIPSEEMDLSGVRNLFEGTPSPTSSALSPVSSKKRGQKRVVDEDVSPPKMAKVSPAASSRRKRGAAVELNSGASKSTRSQRKPSSPVTNDAATQSPNTSAKQEETTGKARARNVKPKANKNSAPKASPKTEKVPAKTKKATAVRLSLTAAKATVRSKAVGSKQPKNKQTVAAPKKQRLKKDEASVSKVSPQKNVENTKHSPKKASPKSLRSRKGEATRKSPKKVSSPKDSTKTTKKAAAKAMTPEKAKEASPKKAPAKEASPKKLRPTKVESKKSAPKKASKAEKVETSTSKRAPKKPVTPKSSPKKASEKNVKRSSAVKASTSKESPKKVSVPKNARKRVASPKPSPKPSPKKLRSKKDEASKAGVVKPSTSKATSKKVSPSEKAASKKNKKSPTKAAASKKTSLKVSPRKTRSEAKPKKQSPKKAAATGRKRR